MLCVTVDMETAESILILSHTRGLGWEWDQTIHGNLAPHNIFLAAPDEDEGHRLYPGVKLGDFGGGEAFRFRHFPSSRLFVLLIPD